MDSKTNEEEEDSLQDQASGHKDQASGHKGRASCGASLEEEEGENLLGHLEGAVLPS